MKICCISDTHEMHHRIHIPACDLLLHAGDITFHGDPDRVRDFDEWCANLIACGTAGQIVCIAGNHDFIFQEQPQKGRSLLKAPLYLEDSEIMLQGLRIYGTPWQPWFYDWAFNIRGEEGLKQKFDLIPQGIDILIAHSPPAGVLSRNRAGEECGSSSLTEAIDRVKPKLVVFGHIHEAYGRLEQNGITFVNASSCNLNYEPVNPAVIIEL